MDKKSAFKDWALTQYRTEYCNTAGLSTQPFRLDDFETQLGMLRPPNSTVFDSIRDELNMDILHIMCNDFPVDERGYFTDSESVILALRGLRPDLVEKKLLVHTISSLEESHRLARVPQTTAVSGRYSKRKRADVNDEELQCVETIDADLAEAAMSSVATRTRSKTSSYTLISLSSPTTIPKPASTECGLPFTSRFTPTQTTSKESVPKSRSSKEEISAVLTNEPRTQLSSIDRAVSPAEEKPRLHAQTLTAAPLLPGTCGSHSQPAIVSRPSVTETWVHRQYLLHGFNAWGSFKGYASLKTHLRKSAPAPDKDEAIRLLERMRKGRRFDTTQDGPASVQARRANREDEASQHVAPTLYPSASRGPVPLPNKTPPSNDLLARKMERLKTKEVLTGMNSCEVTPAFYAIDDKAMDQLLAEDSDDGASTKGDTGLRHAPLVTANMIPVKESSVMPQYGLLGSYKQEKIFLNTNVPFSAFVCGVQGSGKSHTTACILENALIPSPQLGRLERPLSALVFSYGHFGCDGSGFSISESAFLAAAHREFPTHPYVKKINVLVSPSNFFRMAKLYSRIPNVAVSPFKLKASNLDIETMLTLMNVSESDGQPLYMAAVTSILRQMATDGGPFNYLTFRGKLKQARFNPTQMNMLQMRLGILESFLDLHNNCAESIFREGEITIMDMSCPFIDANTACTLFKIGLQRYLQSGAAGKIVVLDEAHKYMLPNPGAKALNETLLTTIRTQRHCGVRIVISTQEPTLLADLIALCSVTIIHRFSSPEWFAALRRHIPINADEQDMIIRTIEGLKTGTALVYSPNAVLSRREDGTLVKGTGTLLKLNIRKRITSDGGQSVLSV